MKNSTVVVKRQAEGAGMRTQGNLCAHGNYKSGRARKKLSAHGKKINKTLK